MIGALALNRALVTFLQGAIPAQLAALQLFEPDVIFDNPVAVMTPAIPPSQIDKYPAVMVNPGPQGRARDMVVSDDGAGFTYTKRYTPRVYLFARGSTYAETDARRLLLGDAVYQALLGDTTLGHAGCVLIPDSLVGPIPSTISAMSDKDARSLAGAYIDLAVDVFETAPQVQPAPWGAYGDADTVFVRESRLAWDGRIEESA